VKISFLYICEVKTQSTYKVFFLVRLTVKISDLNVKENSIDSNRSKSQSTK
jgi:hypothetical protein